MGARFSVSVERGVPVPMRDGAVLLADIYRPSGPGRYPVILTRTAYAINDPADVKPAARARPR